MSSSIGWASAPPTPHVAGRASVATAVHAPCTQSLFARSPVASEEAFALTVPRQTLSPASAGQHWTICSAAKRQCCFHWKSNKQQPVPKENMSGGLAPPLPSSPPPRPALPRPPSRAGSRRWDPVRGKAEPGGRGRRWAGPCERGQL